MEYLEELGMERTMVKAILRTKSMGTRVTEEEYARLDELAARGPESGRVVRDISSRISIHNTFFADIAEFNRNRFADLLIPIVKLKWDALTADRRSLKTKENPICRAFVFAIGVNSSAVAPVATLNFPNEPGKLLETLHLIKKRAREESTLN